MRAEKASARLAQEGANFESDVQQAMGVLMGASDPHPSSLAEREQISSSSVIAGSRSSESQNITADPHTHYGKGSGLGTTWTAKEDLGHERQRRQEQYKSELDAQMYYAKHQPGGRVAPDPDSLGGTSLFGLGPGPAAEQLYRQKQMEYRAQLEKQIALSRRKEKGAVSESDLSDHRAPVGAHHAQTSGVTHPEFAPQVTVSSQKSTTTSRNTTSPKGTSLWVASFSEWDEKNVSKQKKAAYAKELQRQIYEKELLRKNFARDKMQEDGAASQQVHPLSANQNVGATSGDHDFPSYECEPVLGKQIPQELHGGVASAATIRVPHSASSARQKLLDDVYGSMVGETLGFSAVPPRDALPYDLRLMDAKSEEQQRKRRAAMEQQRALQEQIHEKRQAAAEQEERRRQEEAVERKRLDEERRRHQAELDALKVQRQKEEEERLEQLRRQEQIAAERRKKGSLLAVRGGGVEAPDTELPLDRPVSATSSSSFKNLRQVHDCAEQEQQNLHLQQAPRGGVPQTFPKGSSSSQAVAGLPIRHLHEPADFRGKTSGPCTFRSQLSTSDPLEESLVASSRLMGEGMTAPASQWLSRREREHRLDYENDINEQSLTSDSLLMYLNTSLPAASIVQARESLYPVPALNREERPLPAHAKWGHADEHEVEAYAATSGDEVIVVENRFASDRLSEGSSGRYRSDDDYDDYDDDDEEEEADGADVESGAARHSGARFAVRKPNQKQMDALLESSFDEDSIGREAPAGCASSRQQWEKSQPLQLPGKNPMPWHEENEVIR